ncbi:rhombosortase [Aliiglaciecola sp. CAU 1673]|uniref:rhombosortase n=1 Tax=Aliiglaciecola sp. CAU 1673 TaxID=3032595 RepID=UPI0023DB3FCA|nr:rhombosortase [Aliiglaciecola sp. CAU 1673]MDF2180001.1 rhombosortase [Aliiglaciecola sp. CAU 1673]
MLNLPLAPRFWLGPLIILTISALLYGFEPASSQWLAYDRIAMQTGEWWRLLTGNFLHTNGYHLLLNAAGLLLLWGLHGDYYRPLPFILLLMACALGATIGLYWWTPQMSWYVGLSGALHGLFAWGALMDIRHGLKSGYILILGIWLKIGYETWVGPSQDVESLIGATVATDAHLFGALTGTVLGLMWILRWCFEKGERHGKEAA